MANPSPKGGLVLLSIFLVMLAASKQADAMTVLLNNNMNQDVRVTCAEESAASDFGTRTVSPGQSYNFLVANGGSDFTALRYLCSFVCPGKPNTSLEVFIGTGDSDNAPCQCGGDVCPWSITDGGFSCNGGGFSHGWGN